MHCSIRLCLGMLLSIVAFNIWAQQEERPLILVKPSDRVGILHKIEREAWAKNIWLDFIEQLDSTIVYHQDNPDAFLRGLPFDWEKSMPGEIPPFHNTYHIENGKHKNLDNATEEEWKNGRTLIRYLQIGVDSGIAYYLTREEKYAQCAIDILNAFIQGVLQSKVSDWHGRGGWLFPDDGFREVRELGAKAPLIYDFIAEFIRNEGKPYDLIKESKISFPQERAQEVFRTYADITVNYGQTGSNHPILEAPNLVYNALAMEDPLEREKLLSYFLTENTKNQDALNTMAEFYKEEGDIWPETSQYLNAAGSILTRLMLIVNRYDPSLKLGKKYSNILFSLPKLDYLVYPNSEIIRWGDGKRHGTPSYSSYEDAYVLGQMDESEKIKSTFGPLLRRALVEGKYKRNGIDALLFHGVEIPSNMNQFSLPRTDEVEHAGIYLQRNLSATKRPEDGLMCFVGGAHMVHGHAEGMNIELYGKGVVLGVDNGRGKYQQDVHENYSRIFAAHNTVIVNGSSQGEGGWVNLGMNSLNLIAMEPMPHHEAISPDYSFTTTGFIDDKGDKAEATQERTLALIRTSPETGYYVDVFRSKSKLPNEYHDYVYHNIGDELVFMNKDISFKPDPERYMDNADGKWVQNRQYRNPGWHFFKDVKTSAPYSKDLKAQFVVRKLEKSPISMGLHIPGFEGREYTKVMAPQTFEAPKPYNQLPTPTLIIRKKGEAWDQPFVVVYEPYEGGSQNNSVLSVRQLKQNEKFRGLEIVSKIKDEILIQYIITQSINEVFEDEKLGVYFKGSFAVVTIKDNHKLLDIYIGEGEHLVYGNCTLLTDGAKKSAYKNFRPN